MKIIFHFKELILHNKNVLLRLSIWRSLIPRNLFLANPSKILAEKICSIAYLLNEQSEGQRSKAHVGDETIPLYIHGVETKNPEEWCLAKLSVFEKDKRKNHSLQVAFQSKFSCQTNWLENYKTKIVDSLAKNLLDNHDKVDYPLLEEKHLAEKFSPYRKQYRNIQNYRTRRKYKTQL